MIMLPVSDISAAGRFHFLAACWPPATNERPLIERAMDDAGSMEGRVSPGRKERRGGGNTSGRQPTSSSLDSPDSQGRRMDSPRWPSSDPTELSLSFPRPLNLRPGPERAASPP